MKTLNWIIFIDLFLQTYFKARALLEKERIAKQDILLEQSFNTLTADLLQVCLQIFAISSNDDIKMCVMV